MVSAAQVHAALTARTLVAARRCCPIVRVRAAGVTRARVSRAGAVAGRGRTERALSERSIGRRTPRMSTACQLPCMRDAAPWMAATVTQSAGRPRTAALLPAQT